MAKMFDPMDEEAADVTSMVCREIKVQKKPCMCIAISVWVCLAQWPVENMARKCCLAVNDDDVPAGFRHRLERQQSDANPPSQSHSATQLRFLHQTRHGSLLRPPGLEVHLLYQMASMLGIMFRTVPFLWRVSTTDRTWLPNKLVERHTRSTTTFTRLYHSPN